MSLVLALSMDRELIAGEDSVMMIREGQMRTLGKESFEYYVRRLTDRVLATNQREGGAPGTPDEVSELVRNAIAAARSQGFDCEGDVSPVVMLNLTVRGVRREAGVYPWVFAVLRSAEGSASDRLDAIYALLPVDERRLYFDSV